VAMLEVGEVARQGLRGRRLRPGDAQAIALFDLDLRLEEVDRVQSNLRERGFRAAGKAAFRDADEPRQDLAELLDGERAGCGGGCLRRLRRSGWSGAVD